MMRLVTVIAVLLGCMGARGTSWASDSTFGPCSKIQAPQSFRGEGASRNEVGILTILPAEHGVFRAYQLAPDVKTRLASHQDPAGEPEVYQDLEIQPVPARQQVPEFAHVPGDGTGCQNCGGGSSFPYNRCGCNPTVFPWIDGPGNCDQWCVGPKWNVEVDGLMIFREDATWDPIVAAVGGDPSLVTQFDQAPGARIVVTGYNHARFGMQVVYEGVYSWDATALFPQDDAIRTFDYETSLNSVEINFLQRRPQPWKLFAGFRYVEIQENFSDFTTVDKPIPVPADPPAEPVVYVDTGTEYLLKNRLLGIQLGALRDSWQWKKWFTLEAFANAGIYSNLFRRDNVERTVTTINRGGELSIPDPILDPDGNLVYPDIEEFSQEVTTVDTKVRSDYTDVSFLGEVGITGIVRIHRCVALRGGYQAMLVDGVGQGMDAFFASGMNNGTVFYHGLQFGVEYRR